MDPLTSASLLPGWWIRPLLWEGCFFLKCIQVSQEAGQVVWYSRLFQNFPQFIVVHTVKGFGIVNKAEIDVFYKKQNTLLLTESVPCLRCCESLSSGTAPVSTLIIAYQPCD